MEQSILQKNIEILEKMFPDFRRDILSLKAKENILEVSPSRSGELWGKVRGITICSRHNPVREAERIVSTSLSARPGCIIAVHTGLGYRLKALRRMFPHTPLVIVEPDISLFLEVIEHIDLSQILDSPDVTLLLGAAPETVLSVLSNLQFIGPLEILVHRGFEDSGESQTEMLLEKLHEFARRKEVNTNTLKRFGKTWLKNLFTNLSRFKDAGSLHCLHKVLEELPVLVLAAGPSLDLCSLHIHKLKKRMAIVAVDTAANWCRIHNVTPDFVVVIDPQYWNTRHLDHIPGDPVLLSESSTHPRVFRLHRGTYYFCRSLFPLGRYFDEKAGIKGELGAGGSVSTSAWDFAHYLTDGPVYIAGLDLGFPDNKTHYKGSFFEERSHLLSSRILPASTAHFHALRDGSPFEAENNCGSKTLTDQRLIVYKWWFENQLAVRKDEEDGNLSPKGIKINGLPYTPVEDLLAFEPVSNRIDSIFTRVRDKRFTTAPIDSHIDALISGLEELLSVSKEGVSVSEKLSGMLRGEKNPHVQNELLQTGLKLLERVDTALQCSEYKDIAGFLIQEISADLSEQTDPIYAGRLLYRHLSESIEYQISLIHKQR